VNFSLPKRSKSGKLKFALLLFPDKLRFNIDMVRYASLTHPTDATGVKKQKRRPLSLYRKGGERPVQINKSAFPNFTTWGRTSRLIEGDK
jgi:hypothetical protein